MIKVAQISTTNKNQKILDEALPDYLTGNVPTTQQIKVWEQNTKIGQEEWQKCLSDMVALIILIMGQYGDQNTNSTQET